MSQIGFRLACLLAAVLLLVGCQREPEVYRDRLLVFGTLVDVSLYGVSQQQGQAAGERLHQQMQAQQRDWNPWQPGLLAEINMALAAGRDARVDGELLILITRARALSAQSGGLFNPALGRLIGLWGFQHADEDLPNELPDAAAVSAVVRADPRMSDLRIDGDRLRSNNPALQLDLGACAKGYAIDLALATLRQMGIRNAIVNAGGDLRAMGRPGERRWRIGIRHPREAGVLASVEVDDGESVFTSGDYERFFEKDGRRYHHILDPRSGYPAGESSSVTIIHDDAVTADAAATALFIAGPDAWAQVARDMGVRYVMLIDTQGRAYMTPAMAERIYFEHEPSPQVILVAL